MEVYRRCGWSESDIDAAFLRHPKCLKFSDKEIMGNMEFLVNEFGYKPADIAKCPVLIKLSLEKRIKPRCLVARILNEKGLLKKTTSGMNALLKMSEDKFLKRYIVKFDKDIPELLDIYLSRKAKLSPDP
ncbi:hypothetical protein CASFOL_008951 [Castilleja foliolosa]|uniref:Uncharacterized protein n=1 Tax=Castilleja foliolosa TaxID=1961234 RepID=A0ABD3E0E9_9LAMI